MLSLAFDLLDLGLGLVDDLLLALFAFAGRLDGDGFHQRDGAIEGGLAHLGYELDSRQAHVDQLDAATGRLALTILGKRMLGVLFDLLRDLEPSQRNRFLGLRGHDEVEHGLVRLGTGGLFAGFAGLRDHLRRQAQTCKSSCGSCSGRSRRGCWW